MSDNYTKLFSSITESTIWSEPAGTRLVWITFLAKCNKHGEVYGSVPGMARLSNVTLEECEAAIATFLSPDKWSRTPDNEGRRVEVIDGGWRILNHSKFDAIRGREERAAYKREWDRKNRGDRPSFKDREPPTTPDNPRQNPTDPTPPVSSQQSEKKKAKACASPVSEAPPRNDPIPYQRIADLYNQTMRLLPKVAKVNSTRKTLIRRAWEDGEERKSLDFWTAYFEECEASNFLNGKGPYTNGHENWRPDFDYLMQGKTILRTYEKALTRMEQEQ